VKQLSLCLGAAMLLAFATVEGSTAQTPAQNSTPDQLEAPDAPRVYRTTRTRVALGRSIKVDRNEEVTDAVVVVGGSLRIDGRVRDGVVVVGGNLELGPTADIFGDVVVVGGSLLRAEGAQLRGSVSDVTFGEWRPWQMAGLWIPVMDFGDFGRWLSLFSTIFRVSLLAVLMALLLIVARAPVARIGRAAAAEPAKALVLGLAAELLFLPALIIASIGLIVTLIGIPLLLVLIPFALLAMFVALLLGFTALACRLGEWIQDRLGWQAHSAFVSTALGLVIILGPTLLARLLNVAAGPLWFIGFSLLTVGILVEFIVWTIGLGAALMTGFGRWATAPPPLPDPPPMAVPQGI
jgi:hypothetical protein